MIGPIMLQILVVNSIYVCRYSESRQNFLYSCDGSGCGKMLIEFHSSYGLPGEVDMFIVTTVLQYLVLRKQIVAAWTLKVYTENHPSINRQDYCFCVKFNICAVIYCYHSTVVFLYTYDNNSFLFFRGPPFKHALLNFAWFLLLAIEQKESISAFSTLVELYKPSLQR